MRGLVGVALGLALLTALAASAAAAPAVPATDSATPDDTLITIHVDQRGDASWTIAFGYRLSNENETAAFESVREDIRSDPAQYERQFADRMERTVASAENATGRSMGVRNVTVSTRRRSLPNEVGFVRYRFEWTSFAARNGDRLRVGDAIDGLYLDGGTSLIVNGPDGWSVGSASPEPDDRRATGVTWTGPRSFTDGAPRVVLEPAPVTPGDQSTPTPEQGAGLPWVAIAGVVVLAAGGFAFWYRRRDDGPPPDLLSDGERVRELVASNEGRMKQAAIAEELDWTAAKTSRVVNGMQDDGALDVFRIGRENVVALPDDDDPE